MDRWMNGGMNKRHGPPPYTSAFYWKTQTQNPRKCTDDFALKKHVFEVGPNVSKKFSVLESLVIQWLRLCTPNARGPSSIPGQGTRCHMPQLKHLCKAPQCH